MELPSDAGDVILTIFPTDPMVRRKKRMLRTGALWIIVPVVVGYIILSVNKVSQDTLVWGSTIVTVLAIIVGLGLYILISHRLRLSTEAFTIRGNGLESASTVLDRIRGVAGFVRKERVDHLELRSSATDPRYSHLVDWLVIMHLKDGKTKVAGRRSPVKAKAAIEAMRKAWDVPVDERTNLSK
jgi:hypothetical protein